MIRRSTASLLILVLGAIASSGCMSFSWPTFWPFSERENTTYHVPSLRMEAVDQFAAKSTGVDSPEQRKLTDQLARQMQIEPDPLVREAVIESIAEFRTPMASEVLQAGLKDESRAVRIASCRALGARGEPSTVAALAAALRDDEEIDVRLAAAEALGGIKSPEAVQALIVALDDRDPALQYVGVESMKAISGKNFGGDVRLWRAYAAGENPAEPPAPSIAERIRAASPF